MDRFLKLAIVVYLGLLLSLIVLLRPGYAASMDSYPEGAEVDFFASSYGEGSESLGPEREEGAPPLEENSGEAGAPYEQQVLIEDQQEEEEQESINTGEAGLPEQQQPVAKYDEEEEQQESYSSGEAGLPEQQQPVAKNDEEEEQQESYSSGEAGLPESDSSGVLIYPGEVAPLVDEPGEAGLSEPEDEDEEPEIIEETEEESESGSDVSDTEPKEDVSEVLLKLDEINAVLLFILGSIWCGLGALVAFKIGGSIT